MFFLAGLPSLTTRARACGQNWLLICDCTSWALASFFSWSAAVLQLCVRAFVLRQTVRTNASLQSCPDPGAWLSEEVWGVITNRFAPWCHIKNSVVSRFLQIGLVRPSETTLQALVAVIWLGRNKVSDELDVEDCRLRTNSGQVEK
mgnify:CR=1 FL=1